MASLDDLAAAAESHFSKSAEPQQFAQAVEQMQTAQQSQQPQSNIFENFVKPAAKVAGKGLFATGAGAINAIGNAGISAANLPLEALKEAGGPDITIPPGDLSRYVDPNYQSLYQLGGMGGDIASYLGAYGALPKVASKASGLSRMLGEALKGAGIGGALGEFSPFGRWGSAAIGSVAPGAYKSSNRGAAKMIGEDAKAIQQELGPLYDALLMKSGKVPLPQYSAAIHDLLQSPVLSREVGARKSIEKFFNSKTAHSAKEAIRDLRAEQRDMLSGHKVRRSSQLPSGDKADYNLISKAIDDIETQMAKGFGKKHPTGMQELKELDKRYATEYGPYDFLELENYLHGTGSARGVTKGIHNMADYPADVHEFFMKKYPELYLKKYLYPALGLGGTGAVLKMSGNKIADYFANLVGGGQE